MKRLALVLLAFTVLTSQAWAIISVPNCVPQSGGYYAPPVYTPQYCPPNVVLEHVYPVQLFSVGAYLQGQTIYDLQQEELNQLRQQLQKYQQPQGDSVSHGPPPQYAPPEQPQEQYTSEDPGLTVLEQNCANCHNEGSVYVRKGAPLLFNFAHKLLQLDLRMIAKMEEDITSGHMPLYPTPPLSEQEQALALAYLKGLKPPIAIPVAEPQGPSFPTETPQQRPQPQPAPPDAPQAPRDPQVSVDRPITFDLPKSGLFPVLTSVSFPTQKE